MHRAINRNAIYIYTTRKGCSGWHRRTLRRRRWRNPRRRRRRRGGSPPRGLRLRRSPSSRSRSRRPGGFRGRGEARLGFRGVGRAGESETRGRERAGTGRSLLQNATPEAALAVNKVLAETRRRGRGIRLEFREMRGALMR